MYKLTLTSSELAHVQQALWAYGPVLCREDYDADVSKTHRQVWKKISDTEEKRNGL
jgi:hypothetical protein